MYNLVLDPTSSVYYSLRVSSAMVNVPYTLPHIHCQLQSDTWFNDGGCNLYTDPTFSVNYSLRLGSAVVDII